MQYAVSHALMGPHLNKLRGMQDSLDSPKAMKSSPILGPFCDSEFWGFSLLKI